MPELVLRAPTVLDADAIADVLNTHSTAVLGLHVVRRSDTYEKAA